MSATPESGELGHDSPSLGSWGVTPGRTSQHLRPWSQVKTSLDSRIETSDTFGSLPGNPKRNSRGNSHKTTILVTSLHGFMCLVLKDLRLAVVRLWLFLFFVFCNLD